MKNYRLYTAGILSITMMMFSTGPALAQVVGDASTTSTTTDISTSTSTSQTEVVTTETLINTQNSTDLVDTSSSTQNTIPADTLVQTQDPNELLLDNASSTVPVDTSTTTAIIIDTPPTDAGNTAPLNDNASSTDALPITLEEVPQDVVLPQEEVVAIMPVEAIAPKEEFKFAIKNNRIATNKTPEWQDKGESSKKNKKNKNPEKVVTNDAVVTLNQKSGAPVVSGVCSNVYYVILLYKNETDYNTDPASYILNNAYPCVGGQYSFEVNNIPKSIPDGTYYLLVGEMGEKGSWTPITSIVPIDIMH